MKNSNFVEYLRACPIEVRQPVIDVVDSMDFIRLWFDQYELSYTAADLLSGAEMILKREDNLLNKEL